MLVTFFSLRESRKLSLIELNGQNPIRDRRCRFKLHGDKVAI
jgi:hypothetical protein